MQLVQGHALIPLLAGVPHQQSLATGGAEGVNYINRPLRVLFPQLLRRDDGGLIGGGQAGRKGHHQHVSARCQVGLHGVQPTIRVDRGGLGALTGAQSCVNFLDAVVASILANLAAEFHAQRNDGQIQLLIRFRPQVAAGIGHNIVVRHEVHTPENDRETVSSDSWSHCSTYSRENATPPGKKTAVSFLPTVECPTLPAVETGQRPLLHGKCGAVFPKTGRFYYIRKRTHPFKKEGQRRSRPHGSALFHKACGRPPQRSATQFLGVTPEPQASARQGFPRWSP